MADRSILCCGLLRKCLTSPLVVYRSKVCSASVTHTLQCAPYSSVPEEDDTDDIDRLRNVSRLPDYLRRRMAHVGSPTASSAQKLFPHLVSRNHDRWTYGKYGRASGVDLGKLWPSKEELQETMEDEAEFDMTLQAMWAKIEADNAAVAKKRLDKEELVARQMKKMPALIDELRQKLDKTETAERTQEEKRQSLMGEARDYFGFDIDPRDPRFIHMQEMKSDEAKLAKRKKKKEDKQVRLLAMLAGNDKKDAKAGKGKGKESEQSTESAESDKKK